MHKTQFLLLALLVLIVPACGSNVNSPPPLLTDTFSTPFPDSNWSAAVTTGSGTAPVTTSGVLAFTSTAATGSSKTTTTASFANPSVTFTVQMGAISASPLQGIGTIEILDPTSAVVAFVSWDASAGAAGMITYSILGSAIAPAPAPNPDGTLTAFSFSVDGTGTATWSHGNVGVATRPAFPAGPLFLRLGATFGTGTSWPEFDFDNVSVTSP
ncbi:MAG TPA: hypothetical protein VMU54_25805 [Planctomycetota bacterium]|nr:hypothetical protein [Planctomycetota bacterium]